jgi:hypothetical protein
VAALGFGYGEDGMKKLFCLSILALAFLRLGFIHGQAPTPLPPPTMLPPPSPTATISPPTLSSPQPRPSPDAAQDYDGQNYGEGVSSWLAYPRWDGCCCRVGGHGPIDMELYVRTGASVPLPFGLFGREMRVGWDIEGGVRSLFFNTQEDRAWTADISITNINYNTDKNIHTFLRNFRQQTPNGIGGFNTTIIPFFPITPTGLNDTTLNLSFGREIYLFGSTHDCKSKEWKCRVGFDGGGRWGSNKVDLVEIQHKTSTVGGMFFSVHADAEKPCGCAIFFTGLRLEYGYLWSNILQKQNNTDMQTMNATWAVGLRY